MCSSHLGIPQGGVYGQFSHLGIPQGGVYVGLSHLGIPQGGVYVGVSHPGVHLRVCNRGVNVSNVSQARPRAHGKEG